MNISNESFQDLCIGYIHNSLADDEIKNFKGVLAEASPEQKAYFLRLQRIAMLTLGAEEVRPPSRIKHKLIAAIEYKQKGVFGRLFDRIAEHSAISIGFATATVAIVLFVKLVQINSDLMLKDQTRQQEIAKLKNDLNLNSKILAVMQSQNTNITAMNGLAASPTSSARVYWNPLNKTAALQLFNLPPPPADKDYQLWVISEGKPVSAGVLAFTATENGSVIEVAGLNLWDKSKMSAFAITLEPKGGVSQPTGAMYLLGNI